MVPDSGAFTETSIYCARRDVRMLQMSDERVEDFITLSVSIVAISSSRSTKSPISRKSKSMSMRLRSRLGNEFRTFRKLLQCTLCDRFGHLGNLDDLVG